MNENIDLTKILENCPKGTKLYTPVWGEVTFIEIKKNKDCSFPICISTYAPSSYTNLTKDGRYLINRRGTECILFPSKDQRDWSKFIAPWYNKEKFDPKTLQPFDKILVKRYDNIWVATLLSHSETHTYGLGISYLEFTTINNGIYESCIPYNEDTKHLVGTSDVAPDYYRYWEE